MTSPNTLIADMQAEIDSLRDQLEVERIRLAACGVVAFANTPDSSEKARNMLPIYRSASCDDVARIVDSEMELREQLAAAQARILELRAALGKIGKYPRVSGDELGYPACRKIANEAIATHDDDTALRKLIAKHCRLTFWNGDTGLRYVYKIEEGSEPL